MISPLDLCVEIFWIPYVVVCVVLGCLECWFKLFHPIDLGKRELFQQILSWIGVGLLCGTCVPRLKPLNSLSLTNLIRFYHISFASVDLNVFVLEDGKQFPFDCHLYWRTHIWWMIVVIRMCVELLMGELCFRVDCLVVV